jgi:hypothetical protein
MVTIVGNLNAQAFRRLDEIKAILNGDLLAVDFKFWHMFLKKSDED